MSVPRAQKLHRWLINSLGHTLHRPAGAGVAGSFARVRRKAADRTRHNWPAEQGTPPEGRGSQQAVPRKAAAGRRHSQPAGHNQSWAAAHRLMC